MKRVLFIANHKGFSKFNAPYMQWFKNKGWCVDNASPGIEVGPVDNQYNIDIHRSPFSIKNIFAIFAIKKIIKKNHYNIVHCHTPMGGVIGRLAAQKERKRGTKVIYTAHGFHFYKGASVLNWVLYYPIEKILSKITDAVVTINEEDFSFAKKHRLSNHIYKINGIGVDIKKFHPYSYTQKIEKRKEFGYDEFDFIILYTAQFIRRKNHEFLIKNIPFILKKIPSLKVIFAGNGDTLDACKSLSIKYKLDKIINFVGARKDIDVLCGISDIHVSTSLQEGLAVSNLEAMASGCPLVISNIRGQKDVCINGRNGFLFDLNNSKQMTSSIIRLFEDKKLYNQISVNNREDVVFYSLDRTIKEMEKIYNEVLCM